MELCYTALSPFCRKVRMALDWKGIAYSVIQVDRIADLPVPSPRAEVPVLIDADTIICNSPDILAYLDRLRPGRPLYPSAAADYAEVRRWELLADTRLDAIVSVIGTFRLAGTSKVPQALLAQAVAEMGEIYGLLDEQLATREFLCGALSAADLAAFPHIASGAALGLLCDRIRHRHVRRWLKTLRERPEGEADARAVRNWWEHRSARPVDVERINWGTYRLEWLLANGQVDWFAEQVRSGKVLWSVGAQRQAGEGPRQAPAPS